MGIAVTTFMQYEQKGVKLETEKLTMYSGMCNVLYGIFFPWSSE